MNFVERRRYQRCSNPICKVFMSTDQKHWNEIELCDISAGGLKFASGNLFEEGGQLYFNIYVYNMLSEFNLEFQGHIVRKDKNNGMNTYAVKFDNVNKYSQIQLDELIKSKISVNNANHTTHEDGVYTYLFIPRVKAQKLKMYR